MHMPKTIKNLCFPQNKNKKMKILILFLCIFNIAKATIEIDIVKYSPETPAENNQPLPPSETDQPTNNEEPPVEEPPVEPSPSSDEPPVEQPDEQPEQSEEPKALEAVLQSKGTELNKGLLEIYPELKEKYDKYQNEIKECYDTHVTENLTVNIFQDKVNNIIAKFFVSDDQIGF